MTARPRPRHGRRPRSRSRWPGQRLEAALRPRGKSADLRRADTSHAHCLSDNDTALVMIPTPSQWPSMDSHRYRRTCRDSGLSATGSAGSDVTQVSCQAATSRFPCIEGRAPPWTRLGLPSAVFGKARRKLRRSFRSESALRLAGSTVHRDSESDRRSTGAGRCRATADRRRPRKFPPSAASDS